MKILILEDDVKICGFIKSLLEKYYFKSIKQIDESYNVNEAVKLINSVDYDLFLFDVQLGKETSFEVFDIIDRKHTKVIFITGNEKYAIDAIKIEALDYILKPIDIQDFKKAIDKAIVHIDYDHKKENANYFAAKQEGSFVIKAVESIKLIKLNEVLYLEADGPYTYFYLINGEKITATKHLKDYESKLEDTGFFRVHNSFIINTLKMIGIQKKDGLTVEMPNNKSIVISSRRKDDFFHFIENHLEI